MNLLHTKVKSASVTEIQCSHSSHIRQDVFFLVFIGPAPLFYP